MINVFLSVLNIFSSLVLKHNINQKIIWSLFTHKKGFLGSVFLMVFINKISETIDFAHYFKKVVVYKVKVVNNRVGGINNRGEGVNNRRRGVNNRARVVNNRSEVVNNIWKLFFIFRGGVNNRVGGVNNTKSGRNNIL